MDFDLDATQQSRVARLAALVGVDPRNDDGLPGFADASLIASVHSDPLLTGDDVSLLDRIVLVERPA